jgi:hypothetical protein
MEKKPNIFFVFSQKIIRMKAGSQVMKHGFFDYSDFMIGSHA